MELPLCRWRGDQLPSGRWQCKSAKLIAPMGVRGDTCQTCYCRDHEPVAIAAIVAPGLGDLVKSALSLVGITEERVTAWLGKCGCAERREKLNRLGAWAQRVLRRMAK